MMIKTTFYAYHKIHGYWIMPFELRNTRAICQSLVNRMFSKELSNNIEENAGNMIVKSAILYDHLKDLQEVF